MKRVSLTIATFRIMMKNEEWNNSRRTTSSGWVNNLLYILHNVLTIKYACAQHSVYVQHTLSHLSQSSFHPSKWLAFVCCVLCCPECVTTAFDVLTFWRSYFLGLFFFFLEFRIIFYWYNRHITAILAVDSWCRNRSAFFINIVIVFDCPLRIFALNITMISIRSSRFVLWVLLFFVVSKTNLSTIEYLARHIIWTEIVALTSVANQINMDTMTYYESVFS